MRTIRAIRFLMVPFALGVWGCGLLPQVEMGPVLGTQQAGLTPFNPSSAPLAGSLTGSFLPPGVVPSGPLSARVDAMAGAVMPANGPGGVVLVVRDRQITHLAGYGLAGLAAATPYTPSTVQDLASCSKAFTAFAALVLHERGSLSLDDPVTRFIPELARSSAPQRPIQVRDLMNMTSGLADYLELIPDLKSVPSNAEVAVTVGNAPRRFSTGSRHVYSNTDYVMLALLVERAAGTRFAEFLRREIFSPLGMTATQVVDDPANQPANRADPCTWNAARNRWDVDPNVARIVGDGQVFTCGNDLAKWILELDRPTRIRPDTLAMAFQRGRTDDGQEVEYGFGWFCGGSPGARYVNHAGAWNGVSTYVVFHPDLHSAVYVISNNDGLDAAGLGDRIDALVAPARAAQYPSAKAAASRAFRKPPALPLP